MGASWQHPDLGRLEFDGTTWATIVSVPAFKAFTYQPRYGNGRNPPGIVALCFEADDEDDIPSTAAVGIASSVLANQQKLVPMVMAALWEDFNGRGPRSGMWWHGGIDEVTEGLEDANLPPLTSANAILGWMQLSRITVRTLGRRDDGPVVELSFRAAFEEEHGVGVLTDGHTVLGTGYCSSVRPFVPG
jgi:hypothetical protein